MKTVLDIGSLALQMLGVYGPGQDLSPEDAQICLDRLNALLALWRTERLSVYSKRFDQVTMPASTAAVQIGDAALLGLTPASPTVVLLSVVPMTGQTLIFSGLTGGWAALNGALVCTVTGGVVTVAVNTAAVDPLVDVVPTDLTVQLSMPRPTAIETANFVNANGESFELKLLTSQDWSRKPSKATTDRIATELYCDYAYPLATLNPWPIGSVASCKLEVWSWRELGNFKAITDAFDLPPGYEAAIVPNLAIDLAEPFSKEPGQSIVGRAVQYKAVLQGNNHPPIPGLMQEVLANQPPQDLQAPQAPQAQ